MMKLGAKYKFSLSDGQIDQCDGIWLTLFNHVHIAQQAEIGHLDGVNFDIFHKQCIFRLLVEHFMMRV